jgi:hypothetical protein
MMNEIIYIFGKPGTGKSILSDEIEKEFLINEGFESIPFDYSNLDDIYSSLDQCKNTLLVIQSNFLDKDHLKELNKFVQNKEFIRKVVIQSEFEPGEDVAKYCNHFYETGYPHYEWVTQGDDNEWLAKSLKSAEIWKSSSRNRAVEFAKNYNSNSNKEK